MEFENNLIKEKLGKALEENSNFTTMVNEEITTSTGAMLTNESENKLFIWQFDEIDIKSLVSYFEGISDGLLNRAKLKKVKTELISIGKDIEKNNVYPVEAILYASKVINNRLTDLSLRECLAEVIEYFLKENEIRGEKVLRHIFKNWTWTNQQKIAILASKALNNIEILSLVYDEFHDINELKYECFVALLNSGNEEVLEMLLNMICSLNNYYEVDRQIGNLFLAKFEEKFLLKGVEFVQEIKESRFNITYFGRKTLDKITADISEIETTSKGSEMSDFKKAARSSVKDNEDYFIRHFSSSKNKRKSIILALRCAADKDYAADFLVREYNEFKTKLNPEEIKATILTLALLGSEKAIEISRKYKENDFKPYEWASMIILGDSTPLDRLCEDYFNNDYGFSNDYKSIIRACINRNNHIIEKIERKFQELIKKSNEREFCEYLRIAKNFIREHKNVSMRQFLIKIATEKDNNQYLRIVKSEKMQDAVINSIGELVNEDTIKIYQNTLFTIAQNPDFSTKTKAKANSILKDYVKLGELDG